jgi:hypothetical protein
VARVVATLLSCAVGAAWLALVAYTFVTAARMESGWSMAPVNVGLETVAALIAIGVIWGVALGVSAILRLRHEVRLPDAD